MNKTEAHQEEVNETVSQKDVAKKAKSPSSERVVLSKTKPSHSPLLKQTKNGSPSSGHPTVEDQPEADQILLKKVPRGDEYESTSNLSKALNIVQGVQTLVPKKSMKMTFGKKKKNATSLGNRRSIGTMKRRKKPPLGG